MSVWARTLGVALVPAEAVAVMADPALRRALADGIEHGFAGALPSVLAGAQWYLVREGRATVGVAIVRRDRPRRGEAALLAIAIVADHRGHAAGTKALLAVERRLQREGVTRLLARVPRGNGRGLYFMLRAGFTPIAPHEAPRDPGDATWFARRARATG